MFAGFGLQFLRLIDKLSLLGDLAFYATLIGACYAPVAVVSKLVEEQRTRRRELKQLAELDGRNSSIKQRNADKLAAFEKAKAEAWFPWFIPKPDLEPPIGMEAVEERLASSVRNRVKDGDAHGWSRDELLLASSGAPYRMKLRTPMSLRSLYKFNTLSPGRLVGTRSGAIMRATSPKH